jgi:metal-dependent amidase/aminoacylase/carboxypeptidase family protein
MYKDISQNPERGFMEVRTSGTIANQLSELGFQVKIRIGKTDVVGILRKRC